MASVTAFRALALDILLLALVLTSSCARPPQPPAPAFPSGPVVDLTHAYDDKTVFWPTADRFALEKVSDGMTPNGYYYAANNFRMAEHGGTHLDAPIHFAAGKKTVDQIPVDQLIGHAVVIDVSAAASGNADYRVAVSDFQTWENRHGRIPDQAIVLLRTGYDRFWPDAVKYLGTGERGAEAVKQLHFPGLDPDAATWLVANRTIRAIGLDTASIDYGQSTLFESHRILYERDVPAFENLTGLGKLPPAGAVVIALPMKIAGGSGAPLRAIAILPR